MKYGFQRLSRGSTTGNEAAYHLPNPREKYFKFVMVRHPLQRLASAYLNQMVDTNPSGRQRATVKVSYLYYRLTLSVKVSYLYYRLTLMLKVYYLYYRLTLMLKSKLPLL